MDIVERMLNRREMVNYGNGDVRDIPDEDCVEAAQEIKRLRGHSDAFADIAIERRRQIEKENWSPKHDDDHRDGALARAAAVYAWAGSISDYDRTHHPSTFAEHWGLQHSPLRSLWPWDWRWFKPKDRRRDLVRAGALIVAEIERMDRAKCNVNPTGD